MVVHSSVRTALLFGLCAGRSLAAVLAPQEALLVAPGTDDSDNLGTSVAMSIDTAVVGAQFGNPGTGTAEVFRRTSTSWSHEATLAGSDSLIPDRFGTSVAVHGDVAIIGAPLHDANGQQSGAAYAFHRTGNSWTQESKLVPGDIAAGDYVGWSVAVRGDLALIAAPNHAHGSTRGAVYLFVRSGGTWTETLELLPPAGESFGTSIGFDGTRLIVGAAGDNTLGANAGAAHVLVWNGSTFTSEAKLLALDGDAEDQLGWAVSIANDLAVVGAPHDEERGADSGSAYLFRRTGTAWAQEDKLLDPAGGVDDLFGWSVAAGVLEVAVGAPQVNQFSTPSGAALLFRRGSSGWSSGRRLVPTSTYGALGRSLAINGSRTIAGAPTTRSPDPLGGAAFVFRTMPVLRSFAPTSP